MTHVMVANAGCRSSIHFDSKAGDMHSSKSKITAYVAGGILAALSGLTVAPDAAFADAASPQACQPDPYDKVVQTGSPTYSSEGAAAGKRNASPSTSTLSVSLSLTTARATAWSVGGSISIDSAIAKVEANTSYSVTKTTTINKTVTDTVSVPGGYYGYAQPKAEYRRFIVERMQTPGNCGPDVVVANYGTLNAIVTNPFFSECVAKSACTPTP